MEDIKKLLGQVANAKIITLIIVIIFIGIIIWKNSDFISEVSFTIKNDTNTSITKKLSKAQKEDKSHLHSNLVINNILLPPSPEKLPSILVIEIKNIGKASALDIKINIDLGIAQIKGYEIIGFDTSDITNKISKTSVLNILLKEIRPNESGYIYLHTNAPIFKNISISSKDIERTTSINLQEYLQTNGKIGHSTGPTISGTFEVMTMIFMWIMGGYFTLLVIVYLNKKTKLLRDFSFFGF
ncbi:MAG: hypothetical protein LGB02_01695 [Sulfurovum sp.]|nr:hypothetical protein [Sulfurovum sp.]